MTKRKTVQVAINGTLVNLGVMVTLDDVEEIARALGCTTRLNFSLPNDHAR